MNQVDPDWTKLPHNPVGFFSLPNDFDRKALKRRYNSMIKVYKPEKFPDEFQKIRAAYEMLDGQLRYGSSDFRQVTSADYSWQMEQDVPAESATGQRSPTQPSPTQRSKSQPAQPAAQPKLSIRQRLKTESPYTIYKDLSNKKQKLPYDYYALALISDIVADDKQSFVKWILSGLKAYPRDPGLFAILLEYFQEDHPRDQLVSLLLTTAKVINDDLFFFATEKLWGQVLYKLGFDAFLNTLNRSEAVLKDFQIECKLAFYVFIIRKAMWAATPEWIDGAFRFLEEHHQEIPEALEYDLDYLYLLRDYQKEHQQLIQGNRIRTLIHNTMVKYFILPARQADDAVIQCQSQLADDGNSLLEAFPPDDEEALKLYYPWEVVNMEVCERNGLDGETNQKALLQSVFNLCLDLDASNQFGSGELMQYHLMSKGPYVLLAVIPIALMWSWLDQSWAVAVTIFLMVGSLVAGHIFLKPGELFGKSMQRRVKKLYMHSWRARFIQLLESSRAYPGELGDALVNVIQKRHRDLGLTTWLYEHVPGDPGLAFYSISVRYVH